MNRIILIGNGFDRAHELATEYSHFINYYWENTIKKVQKTGENKKYEDSDILIEKVPKTWIPGYDYKNFIQSLTNNQTKLHFKNLFLEVITYKQYLQNWVDIENEYYSLLKETLKNKSTKKGGYNISSLNSQFERIKQYLIEYLRDIEENGPIKLVSQISEIRNHIYSAFKLKELTEKAIYEKVKTEYDEFNKKADAIDKNTASFIELDKKDSKLISYFKGEASHKEFKELLTSDRANLYFNLLPKKTLFLNFNYTDTDIRYINYDETDLVESRISKERIQIHGSINEKEKNPVIFGFGDELDEKYKTIENLNDNAYLENIKSIKYLETANYKRLLEFVNAAKYQIFIFGHSCGISDRTLLNTLFEHENCVSIKPFYYQKSENEDNYSDIIKNISRNFNDKSIMRDKVVNKEFCAPLKSFVSNYHSYK